MRLTKLDMATFVGCLVFIGILFLSAWWDPSIRWLHFFQAWLYVAIAVLALRQDRRGYFLGIATAAFWTYGAVFVTSFFQAGRLQLLMLLETGSMPRPDLFISVPAVVANLTIVGCCLWGYLRLGTRRLSDIALFAVCTISSIGFFAADMALFQPRYLTIFTRLLQPHLRF